MAVLPVLPERIEIAHPKRSGRLKAAAMLVDRVDPADPLLLAGGGISGGQVYGKTDKTGENVIKDKVSGPDFNATIGFAMGVPHELVMMSPSRRLISQLVLSAPRAAAAAAAKQRSAAAVFQLAKRTQFTGSGPEASFNRLVFCRVNHKEMWKPLTFNRMWLAHFS